MRNGRHSERGSALVTTAFFSTALIVFVGLVADAGLMMFQRTKMQTAADAAALAGARGLIKGQSQAIAAAKELAAQNGFPLETDQVKIEKGTRVLVTLSTPTNSLVSRVLAAGQANAEPNDSAEPAPFVIGAKAAADLHTVDVQNGPRPWGVPETDMIPGGEYVIKQGGGSGVCGNYLPIAIDGSGANLYRDSVLHGAKRTLKIGDMVPTEPGNMNGPTVSAVNQLVGNDRTTYEEAKKNPDRTPRVVILPLMTQESYFNAQGRSAIQVSGFARFFITYTTNRGEVFGRFMGKVDAEEVKGTGLNYTVKLVDPEPTVI